MTDVNTDTEDNDGPSTLSEAKRPLFNRSKYSYDKNGEKTGSGRPAVDNGDAVAVALRNKTAAEVMDLVEANGEEVPAKWQGLNLGMQRMNAANVLRRLAKSEHGIKVDGQTIHLAPKEAPGAAA